MPNKSFMLYKRLSSFLFIAAVLINAANCQVVNPNYEHAKTRAREDALKSALRYTREAIRNYTQDHGKPPHQLEDLVTAGYFHSLPIDPMTSKPDWSVEFLPCESKTPCEKLIKDVHSSSSATSSKNDLYSEW